MFSTISSILKHKRTARLVSTSPSAAVMDAVQTMNHENTGAVLVMEGQKLVGIFTERDVMVRVVGAKRDPATTLISEVMTAPVFSVEVTWTVERSLRLMSDRHHRHVPVLEKGQVHGLVSIRDLTDWVIRSQQRDFDGAIHFAKQMGFSNRRT
jgi:CBS domain-containing protein